MEPSGGNLASHPNYMHGITRQMPPCRASHSQIACPFKPLSCRYVSRVQMELLRTLTLIGRRAPLCKSDDPPSLMRELLIGVSSIGDASGRHRTCRLTPDFLLTSNLSMIFGTHGTAWRRTRRTRRTIATWLEIEMRHLAKTQPTTTTLSPPERSPVRTHITEWSANPLGTFP